MASNHFSPTILLFLSLYEWIYIVMTNSTDDTRTREYIYICCSLYDLCCVVEIAIALQHGRLFGVLLLCVAFSLRNNKLFENGCN